MVYSLLTASFELTLLSKLPSTHLASEDLSLPVEKTLA